MLLELMARLTCKMDSFFNKNKVLIDPYAKGNNKSLWDYKMACNSDDNLAYSMRSTVIDSSDYDWKGMNR